MCPCLRRVRHGHDASHSEAGEAIPAGHRSPGQQMLQHQKASAHMQGGAPDGQPRPQQHHSDHQPKQRQRHYRFEVWPNSRQ